ncbi:hypothetical protein HDU83_002720 [Entophlyctis luteolus]|nr:hypothetical protein HDU83_002720 [Entophlyctis luteolus]
MALFDRDLRGPPDKRLTGFDEHCRSALSDFGVSSASVAVVSGGKIVFAKGYSDSKHAKDPSAKDMTADTPFLLGETGTQALVSIALASATSNFDTELPFKLPISTSCAPTISDLFSGRASLPSDLLSALISDLSALDPTSLFPLQLENCSQFRGVSTYSPLTSPLIFFLANNMTNKSLEVLLHESVFRKIGASKATGFLSSGRSDANYGVTMSARDLAHLVACCLEMWGPITQSVLDVIWKPCGIFDDKSCADSFYSEAVGGYRVCQGGWMEAVHRGFKRVGFSSSSTNSAVEVSMYPSQNFGIVVCCDTPCLYAKAISNIAADFMLKINPPGPWVERLQNMNVPLVEFATDTGNVRLTATAPPRSTSYYVGVYNIEDIPQMAFKVHQTAGELWIRFASGQPEEKESIAQLLHKENGLFFSEAQSLVPLRLKHSWISAHKFCGFLFENGDDGQIAILRFYNSFPSGDPKLSKSFTFVKSAHHPPLSDSARPSALLPAPTLPPRKSALHSALQTPSSSTRQSAAVAPPLPPRSRSASANPNFKPEDVSARPSQSDTVHKLVTNETQEKDGKAAAEVFGFNHSDADNAGRVPGNESSAESNSRQSADNFSQSLDDIHKDMDAVDDLFKEMGLE